MNPCPFSVPLLDAPSPSMSPNLRRPPRSPVPRRRRPRAGTERGSPYGEQAEPIDPVSLSSDEMQGHRLRGGGGGAAGGRSAAAVTTGARLGRPRSQGDEGYGQARKQRRRRGEAGGEGSGAEWRGRTWRGRLGEGSGSSQSKGKGSESGPSLSSGKKFEDLDNYLRGCASATASKREKRRRRLGQGGGGGGGDSCGGEATTDGSSLSLAEGHEVDGDDSVSKAFTEACLTKAHLAGEFQRSFMTLAQHLRWQFAR